jgi:hypothetical protein
VTEQQRPDETGTLRYRVPDHQDPVVALTALTEAGYLAVPESVNGERYVAIYCPRGSDEARERVRSVLAANADATSLEGPRQEAPVRFADEA